MADIATAFASWSATSSSNQPDNSDSIGPNTLADNMRVIQAVVRSAVGGDGTIASASTADLSTVEANYINVTGTTTITALGTLSAGVIKILKFAGILTFTHNGTSLILPGAANITTAAGDVAIMRSEGSGNWRCLSYHRAAGGAIGLVIGTDVQAAMTAASQGEMEAGTEAALRSMSPLRVAQAIAAIGGTSLRSYLAGLTMSTAGASATMSIAAGQCTDSTNTASMTLAAIAKTTSAWAVGTAQGGLDTGAIANSTWYHFYVIKRVDTGVVDVVFSLSASAPTLPTNYTLYRRIGSGLTNGSAQWVKFVQVGDDFIWDAAVLDVNNVNPGTAAVTRTLTVPTGVVVWAQCNWLVANNGTGVNARLLISSLDQSDQMSADGGTPGAPLTQIGDTGTGGGSTSRHGAPITTRTNTSAQVRSRLSGSDANVTLLCSTWGWIDRRGRDA